MNSTILWNDEEPVTELDVDVPSWIDQEISPNDIAAIVQGGCASGAYMPAVTYHEAIATMAEHGTRVIEYLDNVIGLDEVWRSLEQLEAHNNAPRTWGSICVYFLSTAVEAWASSRFNDEDFEEKVAQRVRDERDRFDALRGYTDQEAYDHENPPLPDDPMEYER